MGKIYVSTDKMRALIADNPMLLMAMSRFGISLGFGDKTVEVICREQDVDCGTFLAVVNFVTTGRVDLDHVSLLSLMRYLDHAHDYFLNFCLPRIRRHLIEAVNCSATNEVSMLILKFYDNYTDEVRRHMDYEDKTVFAYVRGLVEGRLDEKFSIRVFASAHHSIDDKLKELKDIIVRYLPERDNNMLNAVLFEIINCEQDLVAHCRVEDKIFVPVVAALEEQVARQPVKPTPLTTLGPAADGGDDLSPRERDIIACVASGMANKEIADKLCISVNTVATHRRNIAQKLEIHSSAGLAIYAVINGIVDIKDLE